MKQFSLPACVKSLVVAAPLFAGPISAGAQHAPLRCGSDAVYRQMRAVNPAFDAQLAGQLTELRSRTDAALNSSNAAKTTAGPYKIQVVFHFVLDSQQVAQLGGPAGIDARVQSQMEQLNADWNAQNSDSLNIPAAFKPLYGNMGVRFVLASKTPAGAPTPGYEIVYTNKHSFDVYAGTAGSSIGFSDVKYNASGGASAWDPTKYYNVWVTNMTPAGILGMATPPPHPPFNLFPPAEQGTVILYGAFGKQTSPNQYFTYPQATAGRTLTHETGHFFNLFHVWGSDSTCADDDGIGDTPLQANMTPNNAPQFPVLDACTPGGSGVMFMNFMDYAIDTAQSLFTLGQVAASHLELDPGGLRHSLVQAALSAGPATAGLATLRVHPNPVGGELHLQIPGKGAGQVLLSDLTGRVVLRQSAAGDQSVVIDCSGLASGAYIVQLFDQQGALTGAAKIVKQ